MGIPGAGLLALGVLLFAIMQVPVSLITLPVIVFVFATQGASLGTIVFAIYVFIAGLVDNVLKPLLLGRGVDVPMPVVLIGALGGMISNGIIGLFIGPVILGGRLPAVLAVGRGPARERSRRGARTGSRPDATCLLGLKRHGVGDGEHPQPRRRKKITSPASTTSIVTTTTIRGTIPWKGPPKCKPSPNAKESAPRITNLDPKSTTHALK